MDNRFNKEEIQELIDFLCEKVKNASTPKHLDRTFKLIKLLKTVEFINNTIEVNPIRTGWLIDHFYKED